MASAQYARSGETAPLWTKLAEVLDIIENHTSTSGVDLSGWACFPQVRALIRSLVERVVFDPDQKELQLVLRLPPRNANGHRVT